METKITSCGCTMTEDEARYLLDKIEFDGGYEYTIAQYMKGENIKDEKFQKLRNAFIDAYGELAEYIERIAGDYTPIPRGEE